MASKSKKTKKTEAAANRAKRKRMGQSADTDDISYDPQLLCIARNPLFLQAFEKKAVKAMDFDDEDGLEFEPFVHAVYGAHPSFDLAWKDLTSKKKYTHFGSIEGPYSEDQLKAILKNKNSEFNDKITALRVATDMLADPNLKDKDTRRMLVKLLPGLLAALRSDNEYVVRVACLALADIAKSKKACLKAQIAKTLNVCWEVLDSRSELASFSASQLSRALLKYVPDDAENR